MKNNSPQKISSGTLLALGAGVAGIATASYYFFGPKGEKHRDDLRGWMIRMKGEIIEKIEDVKELTEPVYRNIIDGVVATYATTSKVSKEELMAFGERLKAQWGEIVKNNSKQTAKKAIRATTKTRARQKSGTRRTK